MYTDGEQVIIHSLGDDKEYIGIIRGIISRCNDIVSYIVKVDIDDDYQYSVRTIPEHCIKPMPESITDKKKMNNTFSNTFITDSSKGEQNIAQGTNAIAKQKIIQQVIKGNGNVTSANGDVFYNK